MISQIVVDNRQVTNQDFYVDAAYGSYHRNVAALVGKVCTLSGVYSWLHHPESVAFALSPDKVRVLPQEQWSAGQLATLLEPRYSCIGGALIPKSTWGSYFVDSLQKFLDYHRKTNSECQNCHWVMLSTDMCLLGDGRSVDLEQGLENFCKICRVASAQISGLKIHIICAIVSDSNGATHFENPNLIAVLSKLNTLDSLVTFRSVVNSPHHFDEELRCIVSQCAPNLCSKVEFPVQSGSNCSLVVELSASTGTAGNALHKGLKQPQLWGLVHRTQLDPCHIDGKVMHVKSPSREAAHEYLSTERSHDENLLTFKGVARWLATRDLLIILRVPCAMSCGDKAASESCLYSDQFWALVPPASSAHLAHSESCNDADGTISSWEYMQLLKLVDSDDILIPHWAEGRARENAPPAGRAAQVTPVKGDGAHPMDCEETQPTSVMEQRDEEMMLDVEEYLQESLERSLGAPSRYNPMICTSGTINNMFEIQCKAAQQGAARASTMRSNAASGTSSAHSVIYNTSSASATNSAKRTANSHGSSGDTVVAPLQGSLTFSTKLNQPVSSAAKQPQQAKQQSRGPAQKKRSAEAVVASRAFNASPEPTIHASVRSVGPGRADEPTAPKRGRPPGTNHAKPHIPAIAHPDISETQTVSNQQVRTVQPAPPVPAPAPAPELVRVSPDVVEDPPVPRFFKRKFAAGAAAAPVAVNPSTAWYEDDDDF